MKEPMRLRDSRGPAAELMRGASLPVPNAARRRAIAFTGAAVNMAAGGTALAAGGTSALVKSVALCIGLGVVGGGVASLAVSSSISSWEGAHQPSAVVAPTKPRAPEAEAAPVAPPVVEAAPPSAPEVAPQPVLPVAEPVASLGAKGPSPVKSAPALSADVATPPSRPSLFDEQRMIEKARAAIGRGDAASGMATLDEYERAFDKPQFSPEAMALRVEALSHTGQLERARRLADEFRRRYPRHPLLGRVDASVGR